MKMKELNGQEEGSISRKVDSRARATISYSDNGLTFSTQSDFPKVTVTPRVMAI